MYASAASSLLSALLVGAGLTTGLLLYVPFLLAEPLPPLEAHR